MAPRRAERTVQDFLEKGQKTQPGGLTRHYEDGRRPRAPTARALGRCASPSVIGDDVAYTGGYTKRHSDQAQALRCASQRPLMDAVVAPGDSKTPLLSSARSDEETVDENNVSSNLSQVGKGNGKGYGAVEKGGFPGEGKKGWPSFERRGSDGVTRWRLIGSRHGVLLACGRA